MRAAGIACIKATSALPVKVDNLHMTWQQRLKRSTSRTVDFNESYLGPLWNIDNHEIGNKIAPQTKLRSDEGSR